MSAQQGTSSVTGGPRGMRRKTLQTTELVQTSFLPGKGERVPLVITPAADNVDLAAADTGNPERRRVLGVSCEEYRQQGAFAEFLAVPARVLYRLPDGLLFEHAALVVTVWEAGQAFDLALIPARGFELPLSAIDVRIAAAVDDEMYREAQQLAQWGAQLADDHGMSAEALAVADELTVADTLVGLAKERNAGVVVVGAHRHARIAELLLGTTTRGVLQHAPCPTLVVRGD